VDGHNRLRELRDHLEDGILAAIADATVHGGQNQRLANTVSLGIAGAPQEVLLAELDDRDFAVSTTSACQSGSAAPSHVLAAMGVPDRYLRSTLRLSLSRMNTLDEIEAFLAVIADVAARARRLGGTSAP